MDETLPLNENQNNSSNNNENNEKKSLSTFGKILNSLKSYFSKPSNIILVVLCNFAPNHVAFDGIPKKAQILIGNYKDECGNYLRPYEAIAYKILDDTQG